MPRTLLEIQTDDMHPSHNKSPASKMKRRYKPSRPSRLPTMTSASTMRRASTASNSSATGDLSATGDPSATDATLDAHDRLDVTSTSSKDCDEEEDREEEVDSDNEFTAQLIRVQGRGRVGNFALVSDQIMQPSRYVVAPSKPPAETESDESRSNSDCDEEEENEEIQHIARSEHAQKTALPTTPKMVPSPPPEEELKNLHDSHFELPPPLERTPTPVADLATELDHVIYRARWSKMKLILTCDDLLNLANMIKDTSISRDKLAEHAFNQVEKAKQRLHEEHIYLERMNNIAVIKRRKPLYER